MPEAEVTQYQASDDEGTLVVGDSSSRAGPEDVNEYVFSEEQGTVIIADPVVPGGSYQGVTEYVFSEAEGTVIISDPPAADSPYEGVTEIVEYTYSDEEGLTVVARPPRTPSTEEIVFEEYEGEVFEAPPLPYEGVLGRPRIGPFPVEATQGLTSRHRELLSAAKLPADRIELFETTESVRMAIERFLSPRGISEFLVDYKDRWVRANRQIKGGCPGIRHTCVGACRYRLGGGWR
jgi:hypothetical protein